MQNFASGHERKVNMLSVVSVGEDVQVWSSSDDSSLRVYDAASMTCLGPLVSACALRATIVIAIITIIIIIIIITMTIDLLSPSLGGAPPPLTLPLHLCRARLTDSRPLERCKWINDAC